MKMMSSGDYFSCNGHSSAFLHSSSNGQVEARLRTVDTTSCFQFAPPSQCFHSLASVKLLGGLKSYWELFPFDPPKPIDQFLVSTNGFVKKQQTPPPPQPTRAHVVVVEQAPYSVLKSFKSHEQNEKVNNLHNTIFVRNYLF